jgi:hypothetical protein
VTFSGDEKRKRIRRIVSNGFPVDPHPVTIEELARYFGEEHCVCLQCGREFRSVGNHLEKLHDLTPDDYRAMYGLPWTFGLTCRSLKKRNSETAKQKIADGITKLPDNARELAMNSKKRPKARQDWFMEQAMSNMMALHQGHSSDVRAARDRRSMLWRRMTPEQRSAVRGASHHCRSFGLIAGMFFRGKKLSQETMRKRFARFRKETP